MLRRIPAIVLLRCPRCLRGPVFRRFIVMQKECSNCGLVYQREPGYFTGAIYASYALGILTTTPVWMTLLYMGQPAVVVLGVAAVMLALLTPVYFVYSRVIWLHLDHAFNPTTTSPSGPAPLP